MKIEYNLHDHDFGSGRDSRGRYYCMEDCVACSIENGDQDILEKLEAQIELIKKKDHLGNVYKSGRWRDIEEIRKKIRKIQGGRMKEEFAKEGKGR